MEDARHFEERPIVQEAQEANPVETSDTAKALFTLHKKNWTGNDRLAYLRPSRYFHFYMFYEPEFCRTCWLPEGYAV